MTAKPLRLVLFDVDGTLVDSRWSIVAAMTAGYEAVGLVPPEPEAVRRIVGLSLDEALEAMSPGLDLRQREEVARAYCHAYLALGRSRELREPLYDGVLGALDALENAGVLLGVATGKSRAGLDAVLERHGLTRRFVTLQTADQGRGKPHPDMVLRALEETGADAAAAVVVGDTSYDMLMARSARTGALGVTWGFHPAEELAEAGAHAIVEETGDIAGAALRLLETPCGQAEPA